MTDGGELPCQAYAELENYELSYIGMEILSSSGSVCELYLHRSPRSVNSDRPKLGRNILMKEVFWS